MRRYIGVLCESEYYETQERLMTLIVHACARHAEIDAVELMVKKSPVLGKTGVLGVRLAVGPQELAELREQVLSEKGG